MDRQTLLYSAYATGAAIAAIGIALWMRANRTTPEDRERVRRQRINNFGRITDGTVLDAQEMEVNHKPAQLVIYQYDVGEIGRASCREREEMLVVCVAGK